MPWAPVSRVRRPLNEFASVPVLPLMNPFENAALTAFALRVVCVARWSSRFERVAWRNRSTSASPPRITSDSVALVSVPVDSA